MHLTARVWPEDDMFVSLCPQLDVASQGDSIREAVANLREAVELFLEVAHPDEVRERLEASGTHPGAFTMDLEIAHAKD
jgi:predicted RNase H-like HicB family nuclease